MKQCFICGMASEAALQEHHIVPRRHGGSDNPENIVELCASCHQAVEKLYDKRFYDSLGVLDGEYEMTVGEILTELEERQDWAVGEYERDFDEFPETENGVLTDQSINDLGYGEWAGLLVGHYDTLGRCINIIRGEEEEN